MAVAEPGSVREVVESLFFLDSQGFALDVQSIQDTLNAVVSYSAPLGYHYEISWALWGLISFSATLDQAATSALASTENSVVAILALDARARGLAPGVDVSRWASKMTAQDLREDEWLLSYEANVQGWLPSVGGGDHVASDPEFAVLKKNKVSFYVP